MLDLMGVEAWTQERCSRLHSRLPSSIFDVSLFGDK